MKKQKQNNLTAFLRGGCAAPFMAMFILVFSLSGFSLCLGLLSTNAEAAVTYWDPQGTTGGDPYTGDMSGTWENGLWSTSATGVATPTAWIENTAACFGVNTGLGTPPFSVLMNSDHNVAGIFDGILVPDSSDVTIYGPGIMTITSGVQAFAVYNASDGSLAYLTISNVVSGTGTMAVEYDGQISLNGTNTWSGGTFLGYLGAAFQGILNFNNSQSFGVGSITVNNCLGGTIAFEGTSAIAIANPVVVAQPSCTLNIIGNPAGLTFSGPWSLGQTITLGLGGTNINQVIISGLISGSGGIITTNGATLVLSGTNTYTGTTTVGSGTLLVNGVIATNVVTVEANAMLGGSGSIGGAVTVQSGGAVRNVASNLTLSTLNLGNSSTAATFSQFTLAAGGWISVTNLNVSGTNIINILDTTLATGTNILFNYVGVIGGSSGFGGFMLGCVPSNILVSLQNSGSSVQLISTPVPPPSLVVTNTSDSGPGTLRYAIANATNNATITFDPSLSGATITLSNTLTINTNLTIDASALPNGIQINGNDSVIVFNVASGTTNVLNSLTITNANAGNDNSGGGIINQGTLTLNQCTLSGNSAILDGGGIFNEGTLTVNQSTLSGNSGFYGGGIDSYFGIVTVNQSTLSGNSANEGGGIDNYAGTLTVNQCTLSGNSAGNGGGIFNGGTLTLNQCTLSGNSAIYDGGGICNGGTLLTLFNSIVAGNSGSSGADIYNTYGNFAFPGSETIEGSNLVQSVTNVNGATVTGPAPITNSPVLAPLGNYGGPTQTMPPLPGSPAIGAGNVAVNVFTNDQRGYPRTQNGLIDIGAVELPTVQPFTANPTSSIAPATVEFGSPNVDSDGTSITQWNWNYGDGNTSAGQYQTYIYTAAGTYLPSLIVTNSLGLALAATGPAITVTTPPAGTGMIMTVYDDSLENGWQDYGYATENYTNHSPVHSGTNSISVTISSAYQGIQIHHADFTNTPYATISFWLNGGATGGQQLQVYGVLDGVNQTPRFYLSPPAADIWQQYVVPLAALGVANATNFSAFVIQDYAGMAEPTFYLDDIQLNSPFVVLNTNDSGAYSLRDVMSIAPSGSTITFDPELSGQTILLASTLLLTNSLTIDASALPRGIQINGNGAVGHIFYVASGTTNVLNSLTITNGNSSSGGGILTSGALTMNRCTLAGNYAYEGGGGIYNDGTLTVNQCTFFGNYADFGGSGILNSGDSALIVNQSTMSGNSSPSSGGGIYNSGTLTMTNTIIAGNSASSGGDIYNYTGGGLTFGGSNLVQSLDNNGTTNGPAPINAPPNLAPFGNYGGPTQTMPPLPGSPAIGAGSVIGNTFTTDQRGYPRTQNGLIDIGAVELPTVQFTANPTNAAIYSLVQFNGPTVDSDGSAIVRWNWNFGDGYTSTNQNPAHAYATVGSFSPSLIVTNNLGLTLSNSGPVITTFYPTVQFTASPTNGTAPLNVQFNGPGVDSGGDAIVHWGWNFGDGSTSTAQNPIHNYTAGGQFYPTLVVTNNLGIGIYAYGPVITVVAYFGLVLNGGFETGDFTGWTLSGDTSDTYVDDALLPPHSGNFDALLGTSTAVGYLSQTLTTTPGESYSLSFWVNNYYGDPNLFFVSWNGSIVFAPNIPIPIPPSLSSSADWTNIELSVKATGTSTVLQFMFQDSIDVLGLDDVSVVPPPPLAIAGISLSQSNLVINGINGLSGATYYTLASTNLALPLSQWTPVATNVLGANGNFTLTVTNAVNRSVPKQFYILQVQ